MKTIMLTKENYEEIMEKLAEIIGKLGPYKMDNHEHALSVMDNSAKNAERIRYLLCHVLVEET